MRNCRLLPSLVLSSLLALAACGGAAPKTACDSDDDCFEGYACDTAVSDECMRRCDPDNETDCLRSEYCDALQDKDYGVCRFDGGD